MVGRAKCLKKSGFEVPLTGIDQTGLITVFQREAGHRLHLAGVKSPIFCKESDASGVQGGVDTEWLADQFTDPRR